MMTVDLNNVDFESISREILILDDITDTILRLYMVFFMVLARIVSNMRILKNFF